MGTPQTTPIEPNGPPVEPEVAEESCEGLGAIGHHPHASVRRRDPPSKDARLVAKTR